VTERSDPLARFEAEHEEALGALARLERAAEALRAGEPPEPHLATAREIHGVLVGAVRRHNQDEERALFPALGPEAPVGPFLEEHQTLWRWEDDLARAIDRADVPAVARLSLDVIHVLREHIRRENEVLFPMARALLGPAGLAAVGRRLAG
jgi:hemerythrin-like domain-containing protein